MKDWRSFEGLSFLVVLAASLAAGLAASYGRELEAKRRSDRRWWLRRLLIIPLLAGADVLRRHVTAEFGSRCLGRKRSG